MGIHEHIPVFPCYCTIKFTFQHIPMQDTVHHTTVIQTGKQISCDVKFSVLDVLDSKLTELLSVLV